MTTIQQELERTLAFHGAPALTGIKPADLISWGTPEVCLSTFLEQYRRELNSKGIHLRVMCACQPRCLLLVYRPERLEAQLARPEVAERLEQEGYPVADGLEAMLDELGRRLKEESFPHEVGLFLGYPLEDVDGFQQHRGRDYKLCGCWKVYSNVEQARACFHRYHCCRAALCRRLDEGKRLTELFRQAG